MARSPMTPPPDADLAAIAKAMATSTVATYAEWAGAIRALEAAGFHVLTDEAVRALNAERDAAREDAERLAEALKDVLDTEGGGYEHFDDHCTPETECCAGHVARALAEHRAALGGEA